MEMIKIKCILIVLFLLSSCSSNQSLFETREKLAHLFSVSEEKEIKSFSREMIKDIDYPLLEIKTTGILKQALMLTISIRNNLLNYSSGSGQTLTMKGATITKTNGFNNFLISQKLNENNPLINPTNLDEWPEKGFREFKFLTPYNDKKLIKLECKFKYLVEENIVIVQKEHKTTKIIESCKNNSLSFENYFWADEKGFVWKSIQWIGFDNFAEISIIKPAI